MAKLTKLEAAKNADAAEKVLTDLNTKKQTEIQKIEDKYSSQIIEAERDKRNADNVLLKLVQPKKPAGRSVAPGFKARTSNQE